jgi:hypothetical protein
VANDNTSNTARAEGLLSATAQEVGYDISKSLNRVRVCVTCNRVKIVSYLEGGSPDYKNSSSNSIKGIRISSEKPHINKARLDMVITLQKV